MKRIGFLVFFVFVLSSAVFSSDDINRRMAIRYLDLSEIAFSKGQNAEAFFLAENGLLYDDTVSDLYSIKAASGKNNGLEMHEVISIAEEALKRDNWLKDKKERTVIFLSELYHDTRKNEQALSLLNGNEFSKDVIVNADGSYLRASLLYSLGKTDEARQLIKQMARLYPEDARFPLLYFKNESKLLRNLTDADALNAYSDSASGFLSEMLLQRVLTLYEKAPEILLYASDFVDEKEKSRFIKLYKASLPAENPVSELYPEYAVKCGLLSEQKAFDLLVDLMKDSVNLNVFLSFVKNISEPEVLSSICRYLDSYTGKVNYSSLDDDFFDVTADYKDGRPESIWYDQNIDGKKDWYVACDYGTPRIAKMFLDGEKVTVKYARYPFASEIQTESAECCSYEMIPDSFSFSPLVMTPVNFPSDNYVFYYALPADEKIEFGKKALFQKAYTAKEWNAAVSGYKVFWIDSGLVYRDERYENDTLSSYTEYKDGCPVIRMTDFDLDGRFETKEIFSSYEVDDEKIFYVSEMNSDFDADFIYEYKILTKADGEQETLWDCDSEGNWKIRVVENADKSRKTVDFLNPSNNHIVSVEEAAGIPVSISDNSFKRDIIYDTENDFYWIENEIDNARLIYSLKASVDGVPPSSQNENLSYSSIKTSVLSYSEDSDFIYEFQEKFGYHKSYKILVMRIGNLYVGEIFFD